MIIHILNAFKIILLLIKTKLVLFKSILNYFTNFMKKYKINIYNNCNL